MAESRASSAPAGLLRSRLAAQGLAGPPLGTGTGGPMAVAQRLLAIQAQDPRGFRLAIRGRTRGTTGNDVERALTRDRSLLVTWLNRGTLHLVCAEDYPLLQALTTPQLSTAVNTRLAQTGVDARAATRAVGLVDRALASEGPLSRAALRERLASADIPVAGQAIAHILIRAALDGVLVRGPTDGAEHLYARVADWLPGAGDAVAALRADRASALAQLAERFLAGHGPADDRDLARWAGLALGDARAGLGAIAGRLRDCGDGLVALRTAPEVAPRPPAARLLGAFEPVLMGWRSREPVLGEHAPAVVTGGIFRGFALVGGHAAAVWRFGGAGGGIDLEPLQALDDATHKRLDREAASVLAFLGR